MEPDAPDMRDLLKREQDEALTRPRNEALEKHGADIEAEILSRLQKKPREDRPTVTPKKNRQGPDMDMG